MQIGWVDFSKTERDKVVSILRLLGTQTALDELGIGTVRDAFSDMFFPGISTLQTRAKYFVILPYLFAQAENHRFKHRRDVLAYIHNEEFTLVKTLVKNSGPEAYGIVGSRNMEKMVKMKPSSIYWNGLRTVGILRYPNISLDEACEIVLRNERIKREVTLKTESADEAADDIVVSPFLSDSVVERLGNGPYETTLVTRLNSVTQKAWDSFQHVYVPSEMLLDDELLGDADQQSVAKRDLHAKIYFKSVGSKHYLYLGSLNASANAFYHNVEFMLELKYKPYYASYSAVLDDLVTGNPMFEQLEDLPTISVIPESEETMDGLRDVLDSIEGASVQAEGEQYELTISCGRLQKPAEIAPIYRSASFVPLQDKVEFHNMLLRELCELYVIRRGNQYCIAKIPTEGIPEDRDSAIYNAVIGSKSGFLAYVAFLLADNYTEAGIEQQELMKRLAIGADTTETVIPSALYERLLRTAAFYPKRLDEVEKIMERVSPELVDDSFRMLIRTFREAVKRR